jgi:hypothetical protein
MYYIVEITSQGIETFLAGFEDTGDAWDVVSQLRCEAQQRRKVRYVVRWSPGRRGESYVASLCAPTYGLPRQK